MALLKRSHLAKQYGVVPATVKNAIDDKRLIICMDQGTVLIDTDDKQNKTQLDAWKSKSKLKNPKDSGNSGRKVRQVEQKHTETQKLDLEKKRIEIETKREALEKLRLEKRKLTGEMVPTDSIRSIFSLLGSSFQKTYKATQENLLHELTHRAKIDPAIAAEFVGRFIEGINEAHAEALKISKKALSKVVQDQKK